MKILNLKLFNMSINPKIEEAIRIILEEIGEDVNRQGLKKTPQRVAKMLLNELLYGYKMDVDEVINNAIFDENYDEMVIVKDIDFYSLCEHHLLPFFGVVHIAYIPNGKIIGLSKIPRIVEIYTRRLQVQERLTTEIAQILWEKLNPKGVAVIIEAIHLCTVMRGIKKVKNKMITSSLLGLFKSDPRTRAELLQLIKK
ncbi:MAG: GTP cyclohydrolase I FolE [candidate division WOR-3 bacterium]